MKVLVVEPMKNPVEKEISGTLESMQEIVGGFIELMVLPQSIKDRSIYFVVNEEGKLLGLPSNRIVVYDNGFDVIAGTFFVCSSNDETEGLQGLTDEQIAFWKNALKMQPVFDPKHLQKSKFNVVARHTEGAAKYFEEEVIQALQCLDLNESEEYYAAVSKYFQDLIDNRSDCSMLGIMKQCYLESFIEADFAKRKAFLDAIYNESQKEEKR